MKEQKAGGAKATTPRSMRTRSFLILIFGAVVAFTFVRVLYGVYNFDRLLTAYDARVTYNDRVNDAIDRAATVAIDSETGLRGWLVAHDRRFLEPYDRASLVREDTLRDLSDLESDEPREKATAQRMASRIHEWTRSYAEPMIAAEGKSADTQTFLSLQLFGKARMDLIRADVDELRGDLGERRKAEGEALKAYRDELSRSAYLGSVFIAFLFIGLGMITVRRIDGPISNIVEYLNRSWDKRVGGIDAHGLYEIEELAHAVETASNRAFRDRIRTQAFTELAIKLSSGGDIDELATDALRWLITQFEGNGGVLWMVDGEGLRLSACIGVYRESLEKRTNHASNAFYRPAKASVSTISSARVASFAAPSSTSRRSHFSSRRFAPACAPLPSSRLSARHSRSPPTCRRRSIASGSRSRMRSPPIA